MPLTPEDVVNKRFQPTKFREGYDQDEVDDFLDEIVVELRRLNLENEDLRQRLLASEARIAELQRSGAGQVVRATAPQWTQQAVGLGHAVHQGLSQHKNRRGHINRRDLFFEQMLATEHINPHRDDDHRANGHHLLELGDFHQVHAVADHGDQHRAEQTTPNAAAPVDEKSASLRVTAVSPCTSAVAAISPSR